MQPSPPPRSPRPAYAHPRMGSVRLVATVLGTTYHLCLNGCCEVACQADGTCPKPNITQFNKC